MSDKYLQALLFVAAIIGQVYANIYTCHFIPVFSPDLYFNDWLTLTYRFSCALELSRVKVYTPGEIEYILKFGHQMPATVNKILVNYSLILTEDTVVSSNLSGCDQDNYKNINISLKLTKDVHGIFNGAITAHGSPATPGSTGCTALPSARYTISDTRDDPTTHDPGSITSCNPKVPDFTVSSKFNGTASNLQGYLTLVMSLLLTALAYHFYL